MTQTQCIYILCYLWGSLALEYKAWEGKGKREEERKLCTWERTVIEGGEGRQNSSQARAVTAIRVSKISLFVLTGNL
jgi:hypothetical protein